MTSWEERMSQRAKVQTDLVALDEEKKTGQRLVVPRQRHCQGPPEGEEDIVREWCTRCGLPDPPHGEPDDWGHPTNLRCPQCGSTWTWTGRLADLLAEQKGEEAPPPPLGDLCPEGGCYEWRKYPGHQGHFGWTWWRVCARGKSTCNHKHHEGEIWVG